MVSTSILSYFSFFVNNFYRRLFIPYFSRGQHSSPTSSTAPVSLRCGHRHKGQIIDPDNALQKTIHRGLASIFQSLVPYQLPHSQTSFQLRYSLSAIGLQIMVPPADLQVQSLKKADAVNVGSRGVLNTPSASVHEKATSNVWHPPMSFYIVSGVSVFGLDRRYISR